MNKGTESIVDQVKRQMREAEENEDLYSNFLFAYFDKSNKDIIKITNLTLYLNKILPNIDHFVENTWVAGGSFVKILKKNDKYAVFKLTESGKQVRETFDYDKPIIKRNYLIRGFYNIYRFIKFCKQILFDCIPNFLIKVFSIKSGKLLFKIITNLAIVVGLIVGCIELYEWLSKKGLI